MFDVINLSFHPGDGVSHRHVISDVMEIRGTDSSELLNFRADLRLKDDNKVRNCKVKASQDVDCTCMLWCSPSSLRNLMRDPWA